jgi:cytoskeletal protein RodZ
MMNKASLIAVFALGALSIASAQTPSQTTQDPTSQPSSTQSQPTPSTQPSQSGSEQPSSTGAATSDSSKNSFVGSITKSGGKYVLHTAGADYQLDDQSQAAKYKDKDVKVNGQLDQSSNTIRVQSIEPSSSM